MDPLSRRAILAAAFAPAAAARRAFATPSGAIGPLPLPGFSALEIPPGGQAELRWPRPTLLGAATLRVAVARDDREARPLRVHLAASDRLLGAFDIRYGCEFQPFDLSLDAEAARLAQTAGVKLISGGGQRPLWLLLPPARRAPALAPQLWQPGGKRPDHEFLDRLASLDSLQQFTWMEGCVLEGLHDLGLRRAWRERLHFWFQSPDRYHRMLGVEATLPAASLARWNPRHPAVHETIAYWRKMTRPDQTIGHGDSLVAESNYTVAYPMAVLSTRLQHDWLPAQALRQLRAARDRLVFQDKLWLRAFSSGGRTYPNWCRGVCWYALGLARTLVELGSPANASDLQLELARVLAFARRFQRPDGLYSGFLDQPDIAPDTSGSAGIAAAMAIAANHGLAPPECRQSALLTWQALLARLTADGMLTGVSQANKKEGGEPLQQSGYRVILQFGMGLMAQLKAALDAPPKAA